MKIFQEILTSPKECGLTLENVLHIDINFSANSNANIHKFEEIVKQMKNLEDLDLNWNKPLCYTDIQLGMQQEYAANFLAVLRVIQKYSIKVTKLKLKINCPCNFHFCQGMHFVAFVNFLQKNCSNIGIVELYYKPEDGRPSKQLKLTIEQLVYQVRNQLFLEGL